MIDGDRTGLVDGGCGEGVVGDLVDPPRQAVGGLGDGGEGIGLEQGNIRGAGDAEAMADVGLDLGLREAIDMVGARRGAGRVTR